MEQGLNGTVIKPARIHRSEEEILKLLDEQEKSIFTVKEYCEMYDINTAWILSKAIYLLKVNADGAVISQQVMKK